MIVPMKKVTLVLTEDSRQASLKVLRKAGVLHVERVPGEGRAPEELTDAADHLERALLALPKAKVKIQKGSADRDSARGMADRIHALMEREKKVQAEISGFSNDMETLEPWGDFDPAELRILAAQGVTIRLAEANTEFRQAVADDDSVRFITLAGGKGTHFGALVNLGEEPDDDYHCVEIPEFGLTELKELIGERQAELAGIETELSGIAVESGVIQAALDSIRQEIEFEEIRTSLAGEEGLAWFSGYIPADNVDSIETLARENAWGLLVTDPGEEDVVPTLVRNNRIVNIIRPVFSLMGIAPGYREHDISFWFLLFLSIFVAMILGDAGYGAVILILTTIFRIRAKKGSDTLRLLTLFGLTTFTWGAVTGTWFGSLPIVANTPLRQLVIPAIATYQQELFPGYELKMGVFPDGAFDSNLMIQWLAILLGIIMISIARIQSFIKKLPALNAFAQLGWLGIVVALYWLIMSLVLQLQPIPRIADLILPTIIGGVALVILFSGQEKGNSFFKGVLNGLKDILPIALDSIGAFGDIISFIRLFAVGLAGVALSQSFNSMAPSGGGFAIVAAVLILVFGHTLNLVLNALSVLVHGVRLNVLEFSGHLDIEWAGINFDPFRLRVPASESPENDKE